MGASRLYVDQKHPLSKVDCVKCLFRMSVWTILIHFKRMDDGPYMGNTYAFGD